MLSKRQEIFKNTIEGKLRVQSRASERLQDQIVEEMKEMEHKRTEGALQLVRKEHDLSMYQNEKDEAKRLQGARKPRKDEEMAWAPPRKMSKWPDWEEARSMEESEWVLEPEGKRRCQRSLSCLMLSKDGKARRKQAERSSRST